MTHPAGGEITSLRSPRVKAARQLAKRAFRQRARSFLAEGPQSVGAALESGAEITELFVTAPAASRHGGLVAGAARRGAPVHQVSGEVMAELAQTVTPQGLLAVCRFIDIPLNQLTSRLAAARPGLVVILANVRDPGNAGTVLRTADAAGADGVVFAGASVDPYNGKCVRAAAGSLFHLPVVAGAPLDAAISALRGAGLAILAADGGGPARLDDPALAAGWPARPPGCSATRRGGCPRTSSRWPTRPSRCPSTARPRASTWPPRPRSACTPQPASSARPAPPPGSRRAAGRRGAGELAEGRGAVFLTSDQARPGAVSERSQGRQRA